MNDQVNNSRLPAHTGVYQTKWYDGPITGVNIYDTFPALGDGEYMGEFEPEPRYNQRPGEGADTAHMIGARTNMHMEQIKARKHCELLAGFGDGPITIRVKWSALDTGLFTWRGIPATKITGDPGQAWVMEHVQTLRPGAQGDNSPRQCEINDEWETMRPLLTENGIPVDLETIGR